MTNTTDITMTNTTDITVSNTTVMPTPQGVRRGVAGAPPAGWRAGAAGGGAGELPPYAKYDV